MLTIGKPVLGKIHLRKMINCLTGGIQIKALTTFLIGFFGQHLQLTIRVS